MSDIVPSRRSAQSAQDFLKRYEIGPGFPIYLVGSFDTGITVLNQQLRALNLVWALIESQAVRKEGADQHIAIIGGGFAGLTVAAGLLKKSNSARITLFERRDTVLPLQHGSDSRWLHPHIYEWPMPGSESFSAALPVLNWTAGRASDVVVDTLESWHALVEGLPPERDTNSIRVFCDTQHLLVSTSDGSLNATIEWVGHQRKSDDPSIPASSAPSGDVQDFDIVIAAVGFGLESDSSMSYWRNETLAQPNLGQARTTYIISGAGDGAFIDLFRLRIANFRQDRILSELFSDRPRLRERLMSIASEVADNHANAFVRLGKLWHDASVKDECDAVLADLVSRQRHDTNVILQIRRNSFIELFASSRISFQNALLAFLLYRCGGFFPSSESVRELKREHNVHASHVINRHGTKTRDGIESILSDPLKAIAGKAFDESESHRQPVEIRWPGGYFDIPPGAAPGDEIKGQWRKEYLPSPMQSVSAVFCSAVAGYLGVSHDPGKRLRVTLHRTLTIGDETVLQQCNEYEGTALPPNSQLNAGRTFPVQNGTIGRAFSTQRVVRSRRDATHELITDDMTKLELNVASREMSEDVQSLLAIPFIFSEVDGPSNVIGVLYLDSYENGYFSDEARVRTLIGMRGSFLANFGRQDRTTSGRLANTEFWSNGPVARPGVEVFDDELALEAFGQVGLVKSNSVGQFNLDFADFALSEADN